LVDHVFKKVYMCRVIDIHYYLHFLPSTKLFILSDISKYRLT
jgi:hypothetical protein